jgi:hypothetical protein
VEHAGDNGGNHERLKVFIPALSVPHSPGHLDDVRIKSPSCILANAAKNSAAAEAQTRAHASERLSNGGRSVFSGT